MLLERYVNLCHARPRAVVAVYVVVTALSLYAVKDLRVVTDLKALLPEDTPSVTALNELDRRTGSSDLFTIAVTSPDPLANARFTDDTAAEMERGKAVPGAAGWSDAVWVQSRRDVSFFRTHALYYIPENHLADLRDRLTDAVNAYASEKVGNSLLSADEREEAKRGLETWFTPALADELGLPSQVRRELEGFFDTKPAAADAPAPLPESVRSHIISPDGKVAVVQAMLAKPSTDVDYAKTAFDRGEAIIRRLNPAKYHPQMRAQVVGAYRSFNEVSSLTRDAGTATLVSLGLVIGMLMLYFRQWQATLITLVPLIVGCAWTLALVTVTYGRLTTITSFIIAMLYGMGIDYDVHVYGRMVQSARDAGDWPTGIRQAIRLVGRALFAAAITTVGALLTLLGAHFKGFFEFGIIASAGIVLCAIAAVGVIPPLVFWFAPPADRLKPWDVPASWRPVNEGRTAGRLFAVSMLVTAALALFVPRAQFENDFRNLRGSGTGATIGYGSAIGRDRTSSPAVILGDSPEQMRRVHKELQRRLTVERDPMLKSFVTVATFLPSPEDQAARKAVMDEIGDILARRAVQKLPADLKPKADRLREMAAAEPFTLDALPAWSLDLITERSGKVGAVGYIYGRLEEWDALQVTAYQDRYGTLPDGPPGAPGSTNAVVKCASSGFILADVVRTVKADTQRLAMYTALVLAAVLLFDLRNLAHVLACLVVLGTGIVWTAGVMGLFDIRLGLYNIILIPTILGTAVDMPIHFIHRRREPDAPDLFTVYRSTGATILVAAVTTLGGFTGLVFVDHKGLQSIGWLSQAAMLAALISAFVTTPWLLHRLVRPGGGERA